MDIFQADLRPHPEFFITHLSVVCEILLLLLLWLSWLLGAL